MGGRPGRWLSRLPRYTITTLTRRPFSAVAVVSAALMLVLLAHTLATGQIAPLRLGGVRHVVDNRSVTQQQPQYAPIPTPVPGELDPSHAQLYSIAGTSPSDIWIAGEFDGAAEGTPSGGGPFFLHYDGSHWSRAPAPSSQPITGIAMDAPEEGWAITQSAILRYTGGAWRVFTSQPPGVPADSYLSSIAMSSPEDGWIIGMRPSDGTAPASNILLHYSGDQWTPYAGPSLGANTVLQSVTMYSPDDGWAVGSHFTSDGVSGVIAHYQSGVWTLMGGGFANANLLRVSAAGPDDAWAVGVGGPTSGILVHCLNGSCAQVPSPTPNLLSVVTMRSSADGWIGGDGAIIFHRDGSMWTQRNPTYHQVSLTGLLVFSDLDGWAIGQSNGQSLPPGAVILRCANGVWQVYRLHVPWQE